MASIITTFGETPGNKCEKCGTLTVLVTASQWQTHYDDDHHEEDFVEPNGETSGHWCPECNVLTAVFIHTKLV